MCGNQFCHTCSLCVYIIIIYFPLKSSSIPIAFSLCQWLLGLVVYMCILYICILYMNGKERWCARAISIDQPPSSSSSSNRPRSTYPPRSGQSEYKSSVHELGSLLVFHFFCFCCCCYCQHFLCVKWSIFFVILIFLFCLLPLCVCLVV